MGVLFRLEELRCSTTALVQIQDNVTNLLGRLGVFLPRRRAVELARNASNFDRRKASAAYVRQMSTSPMTGSVRLIMHHGACYSLLP